MAERIERFEVSTPAGTTKASPLTTALNFNEGIVVRLEILIPRGPSGLAGFRILHSGQVIIPRTGSNWMIADDHTFDWALEGYPVGQKWSLQTHNTDVYSHTFYLTFHIDETRVSPTQRATLVPIGPFGISSDVS